MSGRIPRSFIDDLLQRTDIVELVDARVPLKKKGRDYWACCPFHNEKSPSFSVSQDKQFYKCFGCSASGNAISFLMDYDHLDFVEAIELLAADRGLEIPYEGHSASPKPRVDSSLVDIMQQCSQLYQQQLKSNPGAIDYLKQRGISGAIAQRFGIGFAPPGWHFLEQPGNTPPQTRQKLTQLGMLVQRENGETYDRFRQRIMFPIRNRKGQVIAFGGRVIDAEEQPKYLNSPESPLFHKGEEIYGLYEMRQHSRSIERVLVTEGYMDVIALAQFGFDQAVATLGTAINAQQIETLLRTCPELVFCFDADQAGRAAAWRALESGLEKLREGRLLRFLFLPDGHDPDSYIREHGAEALQEQLQKASTLSEFLLQNLQQKHPLSSPEGKAALLDELRPLYERIPLESLRDQVLRELEKRLHIQIDGRLLTVLGQTNAAPHLQQQRNRAEVKHTPIRQLISLLLQEPSLAQYCGNLDYLTQAEIPGTGLLLQLLDQIHENPAVNAALLIEYFRDHPNESHLRQLAAQQTPGMEQDEQQQAMFRDSLKRLDQQYERKRKQILIEKQQQGLILSAHEEDEWNQIMRGQR